MIFPPFCICESIKNYNASYLCCAGFSLSFNKVLMSPIRGHCLVGATISVQICPIYSMSDTFSCRQTTKRETWKSGTHIESNNKIFWAVICATINKISLIFLRIYCSSMISRKKKKTGCFFTNFVLLFDTSWNIGLFPLVCAFVSLEGKGLTWHKGFLSDT